MELSKGTLQERVARQREVLIEVLQEPLLKVAEACCRAWGDRHRLNQVLSESLERVPYCKFLYAMNTDAIQLSDNISREGLMPEDFGRNRSSRPYMREAVPSTGFLLSGAYISLRARRPSLTAIQIVRAADQSVLGFLGADFDLRDLPITGELYEEPRYWRQIKGDPSIRGAVFHQTRVTSLMDQQIDVVLGVLEELILDHGLFQVLIHFSSNRATIWLLNDPFRYRLLDTNELTDADICLAYPRHLYPVDAMIPAERIREVLEGLRELRFVDEMLYLRSASINIFNGMVSLTFSCDGSHYLPYDEFLRKDHAFWTWRSG